MHPVVSALMLASAAMAGRVCGPRTDGAFLTQCGAYFASGIDVSPSNAAARDLQVTQIKQDMQQLGVIAANCNATVTTMLCTPGQPPCIPDSQGNAETLIKTCKTMCQQQLADCAANAGIEVAQLPGSVSDFCDDPLWTEQDPTAQCFDFYTYEIVGDDGQSTDGGGDDSGAATMVAAGAAVWGAIACATVF